VNPSCHALQPLLSLRAVGALAPDEAATVEAHLTGCPACRAEAERDAEVLGLAALPPISEPERAALSDLPARTLGALRRRAARRARVRAVLAGVLVAAAVLMAIAAPFLRGPAGSRKAPEPWSTPDVVALWNDSAVVDTAATALQGNDDDDTLAALDLADDVLE
jgi:anti-sigma factor RsiW